MSGEWFGAVIEAKKTDRIRDVWSKVNHTQGVTSLQPFLYVPGFGLIGACTPQNLNIGVGGDSSFLMPWSAVPGDMTMEQFAEFSRIPDARKTLDWFRDSQAVLTPSEFLTAARNLSDVAEFLEVRPPETYVPHIPSKDILRFCEKYGRPPLFYPAHLLSPSTIAPGTSPDSEARTNEPIKVRLFKEKMPISVLDFKGELFQQKLWIYASSSNTWAAKILEHDHVYLSNPVFSESLSTAMTILKDKTGPNICELAAGCKIDLHIPGKPDTVNPVAIRGLAEILDGARVRSRQSLKKETLDGVSITLTVVKVDKDSGGGLGGTYVIGVDTGSGASCRFPTGRYLTRGLKSLKLSEFEKELGRSTAQQLATGLLSQDRVDR